jgi:RNA-directed DNA polymerase
MMHDSKKSESPILAESATNKPGQTGAESQEQRGDTKGNVSATSTRRTQSRESVSPGLTRIRQQAVAQPKLRFTALLHHITVDLLRQSFFALKRKAAAGIDGMTWDGYGDGLEERLLDLHRRVQSGAFRALPSRRRMIPKPDGRERPLGIASLEDKIVQRAMVEVLNAIYEEDFLGFSYGFRPGRGQHDALDALSYAITRTSVNFIIDADLRSFFDTVNHDWLIRFLEHRISDQRVIRLIRKWLKAGVMEDGVLVATNGGTPQGAVISPLLANVYLHYVFDLWAQQWRQRHAQGDIIIVRYADDIVIGIERWADARSFLSELHTRLGMFSLSLHPEKTRLLMFGQYAAERRLRRGLGKPETFTFLGFRHICGKARSGRFLLIRQTRQDRMQLTLRAIKEKLTRRMHEPIAEQGRWLRSVVRGYFAYHAVPTNSRAIAAFRHDVTRHWKHVLSRRSQVGYVTWRKMLVITRIWLPPARILHPWPQERFAVNHPR